eukprot:51458-Chlamydomonas_euryale.AAC.5
MGTARPHLAARPHPAANPHLAMSRRVSAAGGDAPGAATPIRPAAAAVAIAAAVAAAVPTVLIGGLHDGNLHTWGREPHTRRAFQVVLSWRPRDRQPPTLVCAVFVRERAACRRTHAARRRGIGCRRGRRARVLCAARHQAHKRDARRRLALSARAAAQRRSRPRLPARVAPPGTHARLTRPPGPPPSPAPLSATSRHGSVLPRARCAAQSAVAPPAPRPPLGLLACSRGRRRGRGVRLAGRHPLRCTQRTQALPETARAAPHATARRPLACPSCQT